MASTVLRVVTFWLTLAAAGLVRAAVPVVQTSSGKVQGKAVSNKTNAYLGIPYAQPPVGPLRFLAPKPLFTPFAVRNATTFGFSCIQFGSSSPSASEDCLTVNVWAPSSPSRKLKPVFIWVYGGGWNVGESSSPYNDLTSWSIAHPEIVFVSLNYRVNLYGYANSPALSTADTNAGLRDQRAAVEWVFANIAAFGGDPAQITLGGQSAGSGSIGTYLYAYASRPLIRGAILMSGQAATTMTPPPVPIPGVPAAGANPFPDIATAVGCPLQGRNYKAQLDCVRTKSVAQLTAALTSTNTLGVSPFVDNTTVFSVPEYKSRGRAGKFAKIPLLTGTTDNEGDIFVLDRATNTLNETISDLLTLSVFRCYDSQQSKYSSSSVPVYRYRYMAIFPALSPPPLRAWHTSDQIVLFNPTPGVSTMATDYLRKAWSTFIVEPTNGLVSLGWKKYQGPGSKTLVDIFKNSTDLQHPIQLEDPDRKSVV